MDYHRLAVQRQKASPREGTCHRAALHVSKQGSSLSASVLAPAKVTSSVIVNAERDFCLSEAEEAGNAGASRMEICYRIYKVPEVGCAKSP